MLSTDNKASPTLCVHPVIPEEHYILLYDVDFELIMVKVMHIYPPDRDRATLAMCRQYEVLRTPPLLLIPSHYHVNQGLIHWTLLHP